MGKIRNLLKRNTPKYQIIKDEEPDPKINFSKFAQYWVPDIVSEPLKNNLTLGNKYRLIEGDSPYPEEFYFYDDLGKRQTWYGIVPGHFVYWNKDEEDYEELIPIDPGEKIK